MKKIEKLKQVVRDHPDIPLRIVCNAGDVYVYQDPGTREDSPEGRDFNRKRDLDILQRMSWQPGTVLPARTVFRSLHKHITTVAGICGYDAVTSPAWKGCPKAKSGCYEKGRQQGVQAIIPPRNGAGDGQGKGAVDSGDAFGEGDNHSSAYPAVRGLSVWRRHAGRLTRQTTCRSCCN